MYVTIHEAEIRVGETLDLQIKNLYAQQNIGTADGLYFMFENFLLGEIPAKVTLLVDDIAYTVR